MLKLIDTDVKFLAKKMSLSTKRAISLLEDDLDLVLDALSPDLTVKSAQNLTPTLYHKVATFKFAKEKSFDIQEKSYVAAALSEFLPVIIRGNKASVAKKDGKTEVSARYLLILSSMDDSCHKEKEIDAFFRVNNRRDLANHLDDWLEILRNIRRNGWMGGMKSVTKDGNEKKICMDSRFPSSVT